MDRTDRVAPSRSLGAVTDDRGQPCGLAELTPRQLRVRAFGTSKKSADPISRDEARLTVFIETGGTIIGLAVGLLLWDRLVSKMLAGWFTPWSNVIGPSVMAMVFGLVFWRVSLTLARRRRWPKVSALFLAQGKCAGCGYGLYGLEPMSDDGCVVCPECGAAWRGDRIGSLAERDAGSFI